MVYRGSLQTDDPRDAPKLVRMSPLRTSRPNVPVYSSFGSSTPVKNSYHGYIGPIDAHRAKIIEERRLGRERDIESVEKVIMRTTGLKIGAPKLRNISQIRESVFVDPALMPMDQIGKASAAKGRPKTIAIGLEDANGRVSRVPSSMLADLKDLERLRNTPPSQRNARTTNKSDKNETRSSVVGAKKNSAGNPAKIRSDIMRIQQMFQIPDSDTKSTTSKAKTTTTTTTTTTVTTTATTTTTRNSQERKSRVEHEKEDKKLAGEINRTRLLAQKLLEASRNNRDALKDRYGNTKNASSNKQHPTREVNGKAPSKSSTGHQQKNVDSRQTKTERIETGLSEPQPRPPIRKRRDSKSRVNDNVVDEDRLCKGSDDASKEGLVPRDTPNSTKESNEPAREEKGLERPDILEGLLKESDRQLEDLRTDLGERGRSRSHWRGFVQSMRLHDVELHSDSEDQRKELTRESLSAHSDFRY